LVRPPTGPKTQYSYDRLDRLTEARQIDRNGSTPFATTTITYDPGGRKTAMSDPDMGNWSYAYDARGNLTRQTDARGQRICLYYDGINRLLGKHYRSDDACPTSNPGYNVSYVYDGGTNQKGLRTLMTDASGSTSWSYDQRGRMTSETKNVSGSGTFKTEWVYNSADLVKQMKYPGGNTGTVGETVNYSYYPQLSPNTAGGTSTYVAQTRYDAAGRLVERRLGGTAASPIIRQNYDYFGWKVDSENTCPSAGLCGRLKSLSAVTNSSGALLMNLGYTYDVNGNITKIEDFVMGSPQTQTFTYDSIDRLASGQASGGTGGNYPQESYTYNSTTGNLVSKAGTNLTYNASVSCSAGNRTIPHAASAFGGSTYSYDCNGNMSGRTVSGAVSTLTYNAENRLVSTSGAVTASFIYDGDGNRVKSVVGGATMVTIGDYFEWNGSASTMKSYYYAGGARVAVRTGSSLNWILTDHLGSTSVDVNLHT